MSMPAGRPTTYSEEMFKKIREYIDCFRVDKGGMETIPTIEGMAYHVGVSKQTLHNWGKDNPGILDALEEAKELQAILLQNRALKSEYNPTIAKLILSSNHGMAEKTETDHTSKGEKVSGFVVEFVKNAEKSAVPTEA